MENFQLCVSLTKMKLTFAYTSQGKCHYDNLIPGMPTATYVNLMEKSGAAAIHSEWLLARLKVAASIGLAVWVVLTLLAVARQSRLKLEPEMNMGSVLRALPTC